MPALSTLKVLQNQYNMIEMLNLKMKTNYENIFCDNYEMFLRIMS